MCLGRRWKELGDEGKKKFVELAAKDKLRYEEEKKTWVDPEPADGEDDDEDDEGQADGDGEASKKKKKKRKKIKGLVPAAHPDHRATHSSTPVYAARPA